MKPVLKLIRQALVEMINHIDSGDTTENEEELNEALEAINKINHGTRRYSKRYLCDYVLHCSESCFNTYLSMGLIPPGYKELGFKELRWSKKDMKAAIEYRKTHS